jgi:hypothetical protein
MSRGITVSLAAVDLLCEQLELGTPPVIFDVPAVGVTMADRARIRDAVLADLAERDLCSGTEIDRKLVTRLTLLCRAPLAIEATGILHPEHRLCAQVSSNGRTAVLAVLEDQSVRLTATRPTAVIPSVVQLIGTARPGSGRSITYPTVHSPHPPIQAPTGKAGGLLQTSSPRQSQTQRPPPQAGHIFAEPRLQTGTFTVVHRLRHERTSPVLLWFDTAAGRYIGYLTTGTNDQTWTTYTPADNSRITQHLTNLIDI